MPRHAARVFLSSTFRDMQAERDHLVRVVFPRLRERLAPYRVDFEDVDLRWGITEADAADGRALALCFDGVDECRPFFVALLGHRYGWVPDAVPHDEDERRLQTVASYPERSITELEIRYHLADPARAGRTFAYLRSDAALDGFPREAVAYVDSAGADVTFEALYLDLDPALQGKLRSLKDDLRAAAEDGRLTLRTYDARWDAAAYDRPRKAHGRFGGLDAFGEQVFDDLWHAIRAQFDLADAPDVPAHPLDEEAGVHERFAEARLKGVSKDVRAALHETLLDYALGRDDRPAVPLLLVGPAGSGKTSQLARLVEDLRNDPAAPTVFSHFVGATATSTSLREALVRLLDQLAFLHDERAFDRYAETPVLAASFADALAAFPEATPVVLVLDAVNQFDAVDGAERLAWLPRTLPPHVRVVLSAIDAPDGAAEAEQALAPATARRRGFRVVKVAPLSMAERGIIARDVPALAAKTLSDDQLRLLLANAATENPLYLRVCLEELRGLGVFEHVADQIRAFPPIPDGGTTDDALEALFGLVAVRLEGDFGTKLVADTLSLLAAARRGLSDAELLALLGGNDDVFDVLRQLRPYLMARGTVTDFFHRALWKAVRARYLSTGDALARAHARLAEYFAAAPDFLTDGPPGTRTPNVRRTDELPTHLLGCGRGQALADTLQIFPFLAAKTETGQLLDLIADFAACRDALPETDGDTREVLRVLRRALTYDTGFLQRHPESLFQQLWNRAWWWDTPDAAKHCRITEGAPEGYRPPWERGGAVHRVLARWRTEGHPSVPWLRSLRPPADLFAADQRVLIEHSGESRSVSWSLNGRLASASSDGIIRVWGKVTNKVTLLEGPTSGTSSVAWSEQGRLASGSWDHTVRVWDVDTGESIVLEGHTEWVTSVSWSADGRLASTSYDGTVRVWDVDTGESIVLEGHTDSATSVSWSVDGRLATASWDETVRVWDVDTGESIVLEGHTGYVTSMSWSLDGQFASASFDSTVRVWDVETGESIVLEGHKYGVTLVCWSADGRLASAGYDGTVRIWDVHTGDSTVFMPSELEDKFWSSYSASYDFAYSSFDEQNGELVHIPNGILSREEVRRDLRVWQDRAEAWLTPKFRATIPSPVAPVLSGSFMSKGLVLYRWVER